MAGSFVIPGLGSAKPNEKLPVSNFAPDRLAAAASIGGADDVIEDANQGKQLGGEQAGKREEEPAAAAEERSSQTADVDAQESSEDHHDRMDLDTQVTAEPKAKEESTSQILSDEKPPTPEPADQAPTEGTDTQVSLEDIPEQGTESRPGAENIDQVTQAEESTIASPPYVTDALEAMLGLIPSASEAQPESGEARVQDDQNTKPAEAEWEEDSSPYESSSSDSSDDSSDDDFDDDILGTEEAVQKMMERLEEDEDDEEDGKKGKGAGLSAQVRSKNELAESVPAKPDIKLAPEDQMLLLGDVLHVVENSVVVQGKTNGDYKVLDEGSVLFNVDRGVIGVVADVIGNVQRPLYVVRFPQEEDISNEGLESGKEVYYSPHHAKFVFTEALRGIKGSDASNLHDEEVGVDEMEFSDDEREQAHKKEQKARRRGGKGDGGRKPHPLRNETPASSTTQDSGTLNYDDEEDGPYKPLTRPSNFGQGLPPPPISPATASPFRGRRGDFRGNRGNRGRGGHRGRGQAGYSEGYSLPQNRRASSQQSSPISPPPPTQWSYQFPPPPPPPSPASYGQPPSPATANFNFNHSFLGWPQTQQPLAQTQPQNQPQNPAYSYVPQPPPANYSAPPPAWPGQAPTPAPPSGAYGTPMFFGSAPQGQGQPSWGQPPRPYGHGS